MPMSETLIRLKEVTFAYPGGRPVLHDINLEVRAGDFIVILGPNGAAKTTLLKIMLGLLKPQQGTVEIAAEEQARPKGYIPQKATEINPGFPATVEEIVALNVTDRKKKKALCEEALRRVNLWEKRGDLLGTLSGGQMQRVMIARALIASPRLLFLDEPYTGLDADSQADFTELLKGLHKEGLTILMVTHDLEPVSRQTDRFLYLHNGHLKETVLDKNK